MVTRTLIHCDSNTHYIGTQTLVHNDANLQLPWLEYSYRDPSPQKMVTRTLIILWLRLCRDSIALSAHNLLWGQIVETKRKLTMLDLFKTRNLAFKTSNLMFSWWATTDIGNIPRSSRSRREEKIDSAWPFMSGLNVEQCHQGQSCSPFGIPSQV